LASDPLIFLRVAVHARGLRASFHSGRHDELAAYHSGSGVIGAMIVVAIASAIVLVAGQISLAPSARRSSAL
jgi:hypothetical protein